jgi:hypothetical protein
MSIRLPSVRVTPDDVINFCKKRGQKPTREDAERWLASQKKVIEGMMGNVIQENLEEILNEATLRAYPDPAFDKQYKAIDHALCNASEKYSEKIGKENYGSSHIEAEMIELVRRIMAQEGRFSACIAYTLEFGAAAKSFEGRVITHRTRRAHITSENGDIAADLIEDDSCEHGDDVFVPEKLRNLH